VLTRRDFLARTAAAGFAVARPPAWGKLNMAFVGVGGRGAANLKGLAENNNVVALCDVDERRAADSFKLFPAAKKFRDYRRMFEDMGGAIDAVSVSTPDHTHAVVAMEAIRRGIHVYCEKPLAETSRKCKMHEPKSGGDRWRRGGPAKSRAMSERRARRGQSEIRFAAARACVQTG
jgi:hypothetical protein